MKFGFKSVLTMVVVGLSLTFSAGCVNVFANDKESVVSLLEGFCAGLNAADKESFEKINKELFNAARAKFEEVDPSRVELAKRFFYRCW